MMRASEVIRLKDKITQISDGLCHLKSILNLQWETEEAVDLVIKHLQQEERKLLYQMDNNDRTVEDYEKGKW